MHVLREAGRSLQQRRRLMIQGTGSVPSHCKGMISNDAILRFGSEPAQSIGFPYRIYAAVVLERYDYDVTHTQPLRSLCGWAGETE